MGFWCKKEFKTVDIKFLSETIQVEHLKYNKYTQHNKYWSILIMEQEFT